MGLKVGHLSREDDLRYLPGLLTLGQQHGKPIALAGVIAGGGMRADGPGRLGVFLERAIFAVTGGAVRWACPGAKRPNQELSRLRAAPGVTQSFP
jgi:hypothetical protein